MYTQCEQREVCMYIISTNDFVREFMTEEFSQTIGFHYHRIYEYIGKFFLKKNSF